MTARTLTQARLGILGWILLPIGVVALGYGACVALSGCGGPTAQQQVQEADWSALDAFCIKNGATRGDIDACRDGLRESFCAPDGGIFADSGACVHVLLSNGLRP